MSVKIKQEFKALLKIILIIIVSIIIFYGFSQVLDATNSIWLPIGFVILGILPMFGSYLHEKFPNKFFKVIESIFVLPIGAIMLLLSMAMPTIMILFFIIFVVGATLSPPLIFFKINDFTHWIHFTSEVELYVKLTFTSIFGILFIDSIVILAFKIPPLSNKFAPQMEKFNFEELLSYVFNIQNVRIMFYLIYAIFLIFYSFVMLNSNNYSISGNNRAMLQSFLTFIAVDRAVVILKDNKFTFSGLLKKFNSSMFAALKENKENNNE